MRERPADSGHWQIRAFSGTDPSTGKPRQVARTVIGSEKDAGKALSSLIAEVEAGKFNRTSATLGQFL
jgi:hypothetical protein